MAAIAISLRVDRRIVINLDRGMSLKSLFPALRYTQFILRIFELSRSISRPRGIANGAAPFENLP
jgi:hypothetical protein